MKRLTLDGFLKELASVKAKTPIMLSIAAQEIGSTVQAQAKSEIGEYQRSDMGGFEPWEELADSTKIDRVKLGYTENDPGLRSGEMRESIEMAVSGTSVEVGSNNDKLLWFEYGTDKQPPRSVVGLAAHRSEAEIKAIGLLTVNRIFA